MGATKLALLRLEGSFWMMRLNWAWAPLVAAPGWLVADDHADTGGLIAIMATAALSRAGVNVLNDILDHDKDRLTAPELPLPSGAVGLTQALATFGLIAAGIMVTSALASTSLLAYIGCLAALCTGALLSGLYSLVKPYGLLASLVAASVYVCLPLAAWVAAGGGSAIGILLVAVYQLAYGLAGNIQAALRDIDSDGAVGNNSIALQLGARRALALGAGLDAFAHLPILAVGIWSGRVEVAAIVVAISLCLVLSAYAAALRRAEDSSGRVERMVAARRLGLSRQAEPLALVATLSVPVALGAASATILLLACLIPGYSRRIIGGGLARAFADRPTGGGTPGAAVPARPVVVPGVEENSLG